MEKVIKHFVRLDTGQWVCVKTAEFQGPQGRVQVTIGSTFTRGESFMGVDLVQWLEEQYAKDEGRD